MKWFVPAWNGDWRLTPDPSAPEKRTILIINRPTALEKQLLAKLRTVFDSKRWLVGDGGKRLDAPAPTTTEKVVIDAPITDIGPVVASTLKPGPNVLTAVRFKDGHIEVCETSAVPPDAEVIVAPEPEKKEPPIVVPATPSETAKVLAKKPDATAAATVKRPTPCCPDCYFDESAMNVNKPATEVLLAFLNEEEHASWAEHRYIVVRGGITGHRYLIAHRNSEIAQQNTRLCFDLDDDSVMHFHLWECPPEEEVLSTKLILEHREPWLRNEATALGGHRYIFKNPFGDGGDGLRDTAWTTDVGIALKGWVTRPEAVLEQLAGKIISAFRPPQPQFMGRRKDLVLDADGNAYLVDTCDDADIAS